MRASGAATTPSSTVIILRPRGIGPRSYGRPRARSGDAGPGVDGAVIGAKLTRGGGPREG
jgi:hypothetical protein